MNEKQNDKKSLVEVEREYQKNPQNYKESNNSNGRTPDTQHHMKDQENLRK